MINYNEQDLLDNLIKNGIDVSREFTSNNIRSLITITDSVTNDVRTSYNESFSEFYNLLYTISNNEIITTPNDFLKNKGFYGNCTLTYNFYYYLLGDIDNPLVIKSISSSRKEIMVSFPSSEDNSSFDDVVYKHFNRYATQLYLDKYLLLNDNTKYLILYANVTNDGLIIKLSDPLDSSVMGLTSVTIIKSLIDDEQEDTYCEFVETIDETNIHYLAPPNFILKYDDIQLIKSEYKNVNSLFSSSQLYGNYGNTLYQSGQNNIDGIDLSIDYSDFSNFIHFGSARARLNNFKQKLILIQGYLATIDNLNASLYTGSDIINNNIIQNTSRYNDVLKSFDSYDKYLYFESSSTSWPKENSEKPYVNVNVNSDTANTWFDNMYDLATQYDENNKDYLYFSVPYKIRNDVKNSDYVYFLDMIGHFIDYIFVYIKSLNKVLNRDNKLGQGIPKDLIYNISKNFGLYLTNSKKLINYLLYKFGINIEQIEEAQSTIIQEIWNRLLNNLPYILKSKGTERSIRSILNCYGIPNNTVKIKNFASLQSDTHSLEYELEDFTYILDMTGNQYVKIPWKSSPYSSYIPDSIEFKFRTDNKANMNLLDIKNLNTVSVKLINLSSELGKIELLFSGSSGIMSASTDNFPVCNNEFYNVLIKRSISTNSANIPQIYTLKVNQFDNLLGQITNTYSSSLYITSSLFNSYYINTGSLYFGGMTNGFSGSVEEFRLWSEILEDDIFDYHTKFSSAVNGNEFTSSLSSLNVRLSFDNPINNYLTSSITNDSFNNSYAVTASTYGFTNISDYPYNYSDYDRTNYITVPEFGSNNLTSNRIVIDDNHLAEFNGSKVLDVYKKNDVSEYSNLKVSDKLIIGFSVSDAVNEDVLRFFGTLPLSDAYASPENIYDDDYIKMTDLNTIYWSCNKLKYNYEDYLLYVKAFDDSLFDQIRSVIPGKSTPIFGFIYEETLLNRNKFRLSNKPIGINKKYKVLPINKDIYSISSNNLIKSEGKILLINKKIKVNNIYKVLSNPINCTPDIKKSKYSINIGILKTPILTNKSTCFQKMGTVDAKINNSTEVLKYNSGIKSSNMFNASDPSRKFLYASFRNDSSTSYDREPVVIVTKSNPNELTVTNYDIPKLNVE